VAFSNQKRDLLLAFAGGVVIEFVLWLLFYLAVTAEPPTIEQYMWLDRLQEPGRAIGIAISRGLYGRFGSTTPRVWIGLICGFSFLIAAWSVGVFIVLNIFRVLRAKAK